MEAGSQARGWAPWARRVSRGAVSLALAAMVLVTVLAAPAAASAVGRVQIDQNTAQTAPADRAAAEIGPVPHRPGLAHRVVPGHVVELVRPDSVYIGSGAHAIGRAAQPSPAPTSADRRDCDARAPPMQGSG
jgi:hypothetical protein